MKSLIRKFPVFYNVAKRVQRAVVNPARQFPGSEAYWVARYKAGGNSGIGSRDKFAVFKAEVLNDFVQQNNIETVIEFGCGDGNQLLSSEYPSYLGFDVSHEAVSKCQSTFSDSTCKSFKLMREYANERAELALSLDVIYHLIEDDIFLSYMNRLFDSATRFVIIYSSNTDEQYFHASHVRNRIFTTWVEQEKSNWKLAQRIPNRYPYEGDDREGSISDFFIYVAGPMK